MNMRSVAGMMGFSHLCDVGSMGALSVGCCGPQQWDGDSICPKHLLVHAAGVVECVEVKGIVDILIFTLELPIRGAVVTQVV